MATLTVNGRATPRLFATVPGLSSCMMRRRGFSILLLLLVAPLPAACHHSEPPCPAGLDGAVAPLPPLDSAATTPGAHTSMRAEGGGRFAGDTRASASATPVGEDAAPTASLDPGLDPGTLPQTHDKPEAGGVAFDTRVAALWNAILRDDPDLAMSFFLPVTAYEQVKAITNASSDWRRRLVAAYKRDIHALHKRLGERAAEARFLRADVPQDRARWVDPGDESNKLGYYRVYGTRLLYELDGKERGVEVTSLISWRGAWYVVHLSGFK